MAMRGLFGMLLRGRRLRSTALRICMALVPFFVYFYMYESQRRHRSDKAVQHQSILKGETLLRALEIGMESSRKGCVIPKLNRDDPDIMKFYKQFPTVSCGDGFDWVVLSGGKFIITPEATTKHGSVTCDLTTLVKETDFSTGTGKQILDVKNGSAITHDFYKVECKAADGRKYRNYHAGIHPKPEVLQRNHNAGRSNYASLDLDVIIIGQDSLSHMAWLRHLPLTRKYLVEILQATEMWGHTVVGDGTPATIFPLLTGLREEDLPEARRGYRGAKPVDGFPWIWKDFAQAGYVTAWQEDQPRFATFHYRLLGFQNDPVDHYYRPFALYAEKHFRESKPSCLGFKPRHVIQNEYMKDVFDVYQGRRKWTFTFKSENSHSSNNKASMVDELMRDHLKDLYENGHLVNALLIVMADHGARFSSVRTFAQGKQEERMPYFAIRLPDSYKIKHPDILKNIKTNSKRLTTPFDVHETLLEILHYTGSGKADISKRGVSLFKEIPVERDCKSADVDPHWCFCLDWSPVATTDTVIGQIMNDVMAMLNEATETNKDKCARLSVKQITSAAQFKVKDDVLKFKDTADGGRGRFGKMNDKTQHSQIIYQISFITTPGDGSYEVTVTRDMKTNQFIKSLKFVSRINKYGNAPWCIMETIPQLRPYCVCKQPPPPSTK